MNEKYKRLTVLLTELLQEETFKFMVKAFHKETQDTSDLINLVLSAHLSSTFNIMRELAGEHKDMLKLVDSFIKKMSYQIFEMESITSVEVI